MSIEICYLVYWLGYGVDYLLKSLGISDLGKIIVFGFSIGRGTEFDSLTI
jgi:hypothetical protein